MDELSKFIWVTKNFYIFQKQISASLLINILALGTGATYGIANVLLAALAEGKSDSSNLNNLTQSNETQEYGPWHFNVNSGEASWIGIPLDNSYVLSHKNLIWRLSSHSNSN